MANGHRRVITSIDEFLDPSSAARMAPMVLRPGAIRAEIVRVDLGGVAAEILDYSFPVVTHGESIPARIGVIVPLRRMRFGHVNGETFRPGKILVFGESSEIAACNGEPTCCGSLSIKPQVLQQAAQALGIELDVPTRGAYRATRVAEWERLRGLFHEVLRSVRDSNDVPPAIGDEFVEIVARSLAAIRSEVHTGLALASTVCTLSDFVRNTLRTLHTRASASRISAKRQVSRSDAFGRPSMSVTGCRRRATCASPRSMRSIASCSLVTGRATA